MDSWNNTEKDEVNMVLPLITIIVPVYNVRTYAGECIESLMHQTYTNLEILLVDDGSTDGSGELCEEYARRDNRVRVIHQENQGLSGARNTGLDHASGEYVAFVDSDDRVISAFIARLYRLLQQYHADIAACAYVKESDKMQNLSKSRRGSLYNIHFFKNDKRVTNICMSSGKMLRQWHGRYKKYETVAWNKLYHASVLNGGSDNRKIRFPQGRKHEDVLTSHLIVENANRIVLTTQVLYCYRSREDSITARTALGEGVGDNLSAQRQRMEFFRKRRYFRAYINLLTGYVLHRLWFGWKKVSGYRYQKSHRLIYNNKTKKRL